MLSFENDGTTAIRTNISYDEYSLALIDLMLPDMSGMEIIKSIRRVTKFLSSSLLQKIMILINH